MVFEESGFCAFRALATCRVSLEIGGPAAVVGASLAETQTMDGQPCEVCGEHLS